METEIYNANVAQVLLTHLPWPNKKKILTCLQVPLHVLIWDTIQSSSKEITVFHIRHKYKGLRTDLPLRYR